MEYTQRHTLLGIGSLLALGGGGGGGVGARLQVVVGQCMGCKEI